jgi:uncharacterized protein YdhG (YjbR/CyaY superfamily)
MLSNVNPIAHRNPIVFMSSSAAGAAPAPYHGRDKMRQMSGEFAYNAVVDEMKKAKPRNRKSDLRRKDSTRTIDEYLASVPEPSRSTLAKVRATIRSVVPPEATEVISYGIPAFKYNGTLVWFAAFSKHCSLFPGGSLIHDFKEELRGFTTSKGTIRFTASKPLPVSLVKKLVKARIAQMREKKSSAVRSSAT